jgi:hypothetical protein
MHENNRDAYCCLGILCEVAVEDGVIGRQVSDGGSIVYVDSSRDEHQTMVLPEAVATWAGLEDENPHVDVTDFVVTIDDEDRNSASLSELNDYAGKTFSQIADVIEKSL